MENDRSVQGSAWRDIKLSRHQGTPQRIATKWGKRFNMAHSFKTKGLAGAQFSAGFRVCGPSDTYTFWSGPVRSHTLTQ